MSGEILMKYAVLFAFFSAAVAVGQSQIGQVPPKYIVGGEDAMAGEFPFVAKIIYYGSQVGCTGTLIAADKVLTAGHCVDRYRARRLSVGFGDTRAVSPSYQVASRTLHPQYSTQENDIAVLQLESAVTDIRPVHLLNLEEELRHSPSRSLGVAVGWGRTDVAGDELLPATLQKVTEVPIYTQEDCRRVLADLRDQGKNPQPPSIHERVLCAGEEGRATGKGDSGGPLLVQTPDGWAQVGVLSQGTRDPSPQTVVYMGQYTRTSYFLDWIFPTYRLHFAHSAVGGGWTTDLVLLNTHRNKTVEAAVEIFGSDGTTRLVEQFSLQGLDVEEWLLPAGEKVEAGGVVISSPEKLSGLLRFRYSDGSATSVQSAPVGSAFMVPVSNQVDRVGLAVFNADDQDLTVVFRMGERVLYKAIPAQGKIAAFVDEYFPGSGESTDALIVRTDPPGGRITVLALEIIDGNLVTLPAAALGGGPLN